MILPTQNYANNLGVRENIAMMSLDPSYHIERASDLRKIYTDVENKAVNLSQESIYWVSIRSQAKELVKKYQKIVDSMEARILNEMKNNSVGILPDGSSCLRKEVHIKAHEVKASTSVRLIFKERQ